MILPDWLCDYLNKKLASAINSDFLTYVVETVSARAKYTVERPDLIEGLINSIEKDVSPIHHPPNCRPGVTGCSLCILTSESKGYPQRHSHAHGNHAPWGWL